MANEEHVAILRQGVEVWNRWRAEHPSIEADFQGANLRGASLAGAFLQGANLQEANLTRADLVKSDVTWALSAFW